MQVTEMKVGDLFPRPRLRLQADGVGLNLSDALSIIARVKLPGSSSSVEREVIVSDQDVTSNHGIITIVLLSGDTDYKGIIKFDVEVEWVTGVQTWPSKGYFKIWVLEDADSDQGGGVPSASQNDSLTFGRIYDVSITDPEDGQFISYDEELGRWVNVDAPSGSATIESIDGLQDALDAKATPEDITTAIGEVIDSAPGALDTLNELAAALGDDANFATTVTNALAGKADSTDLDAYALLSGLGTMATQAASAYAALTGATFTGQIIGPASTTSEAGLNIPHGTAPTSPADGDIWTDTGGVKTRIDGVTENVVGSTSVLKMEALTQAAYDLLTPDANTFYIITDA